MVSIFGGKGIGILHLVVAILLIRRSQAFFPYRSVIRYSNKINPKFDSSLYLSDNKDYDSKEQNPFKKLNANQKIVIPRFVSNSVIISLIVLSWHNINININHWSPLIQFNPVEVVHAESLLSPPKQVPSASLTPPAVIDILKDRIYQLRSGVTGEKVGQLRVGDSLFARLRSIDIEMDALQEDIYKEEGVDWEVVSVYPKIFRAFSPLFTAYTDRAFPTDQPVDKALRYALRYEVGGFYTGVQDLEKGIERQNQRQTQQAFARMSLSYDRYLKAGDLFVEYERDREGNT